MKLSRRSILATAAGMPVVTMVAEAKEPDSAPLAADKRNQSFDGGWLFFLGDAPSFASSSLDDGSWRKLDLPHDWSIEDSAPGGRTVNGEIRDVDAAPVWQPVKDAPKAIGPFWGPPVLVGEGDHSAGGTATGFTVGGVGWYRKHFRLPPLSEDGRVELSFDGVYMNCQVWLNGKWLGEHPYGYTPFHFDLTPFLDRNGDNVLAVRVANLGRNGRWYSGSGIYRHVWMDITRQVRFAPWGLSVATAEVQPGSATINVRARIENPAAGALVKAIVREASGKIVLEDQTPAAAETTLLLKIKQPSLWSPEAPALYQLESALIVDGRTVDKVSTSFGIRSVEVDARNGLRINGKSYKLRGGCVHHDNGLLGAAAIDRAEERKVEILKARGYNAIRTSHNPPSPALLDACDRLGMFVLEEAFDCWRIAKNADDYHAYFDGWWRNDIAAMVRRDGNHPSVIIWSIGNEVPEQAIEEGAKRSKMLKDEVKRLDPTRPVTEAINVAPGPDVTKPDGRLDQLGTQHLDITGYNYRFQSYEPEHARFPNRVFVGTESVPSSIAELWRVVERNPYVLGDFVWTAVDYLGEVGVGRTSLAENAKENVIYPWINAFCGDIDLIGQRKPQSLLRDVVWGLSGLEVAVARPLPLGKEEKPSWWGWRDELVSWTWPGQEGRALSVSIYTTGDRVELSLNGKKVAERAVNADDKNVVRVDVPYAPGALVVSAFAGNIQIGQRKLQTVGEPVRLRLVEDRARIKASRNDLAFVTVEIVDSNGRLVPDAVAVLELAVSGPAELVAFGNANPKGVGSYQQPIAKTWHGRALAVIRPTGKAGTATVEVRSKSLTGARKKIAIV